MIKSELIRQVPSLEPNAEQQKQIARKFGMFIHFGVNTFGNTEWSDGGIDARSYQPETIDAEQWVRTAYEAGMNYVILITKHHDGFCLWDTNTTEYSVKNSGNPTDVVKAVSEACKKYNIKLGLYYSLWDRKEISYKSDFSHAYIPFMLKQLEELMDGRYGEIIELWLDGSWDKSCKEWRLDLVYDLIKRLQPTCQIGVNHTVGILREEACGPDDYFLPKNYRKGDPLRMFPSDFRLWDPHMCREDDPKIYEFEGEEYYLPFEMTICSREGFSWFYSNIYKQKQLLDVDTIVKNCKEVFAIDNIAVINMPPAVDGKLVPEDVEHLMEIAVKLGTKRNS